LPQDVAPRHESVPLPPLCVFTLYSPGVTFSPMLNNFSLFPKDDRFFSLIRQAAHLTRQQLLVFLRPPGEDVALRSAGALDHLQQMDTLFADGMMQLSTAFVTPFEREDILGLVEHYREIVFYAYAHQEALAESLPQLCGDDQEDLCSLMEIVGQLSDTLEHIDGATPYCEKVSRALHFLQHLEQDVLKRPGAASDAMLGLLTLIRKLLLALARLVMKHV
jgi:hypothetical protein